MLFNTIKNLIDTTSGMTQIKKIGDYCDIKSEKCEKLI